MDVEFTNAVMARIQEVAAAAANTATQQAIAAAQAISQEAVTAAAQQAVAAAQAASQGAIAAAAQAAAREAVAAVAAAQVAPAVPAQPPANVHQPAPHILKPEKPSTFSGLKETTRVTVWLFEVVSYFNAVSCHDPSQRIVYAAALLRGPAAVWYRNHKTTVERSTAQDFTTWDAFSNALINEFHPANYQRVARDKLASLVQRNSVQNYAYQFRLAILDIDNISEEEKIDRFLRGLKPAIQRELELRPPATLQEAISIAERVDAVDYRMSRRQGMNNFTPRRPPLNSGPAPMQVDAITGRQPYVKLTEAARAQLRAEGKCFYCREKGHSAFDCPKKKNRPNQGNARPR